MTSARFTLEDLLAATGGQPAGERKPLAQPARVWTDTRTIQPGDFFLPLKGERFNGHDYLSQAIADGALGAFAAAAELAAHPEWQSLPNLIIVPDPLEAYLAVGRFHRLRMSAKLIAVTGSSGKTTTKEMLYAAISRPLAGKRVVQKTEKNFNNEVGVSQTLLSLQPETDILITEMGMRGLHQIDILSQAALPDVAIVVNVGPAHIGLLGSLENIAIAKCEIFTGLDPATGIGIVNGDDHLLTETARKTWSGKLIPYSLSEARDIVATPEGGIAFTYQGVRIALPIPGIHNVSNALAVLKAGEALNIPLTDMAAGLAAFQPEGGRWEKTALPGCTNGWVINDAYNANPASMRAALQAFLEADFPGLKRTIVLAGMKELGEFTERYHREIGEWLTTQPDIERLICVGEEGRWLAEAADTGAFPVHAVSDVSEIVELFEKQNWTPENTLLFLKGSRAFKLETLPEQLGRACHGV